VLRSAIGADDEVVGPGLRLAGLQVSNVSIGDNYGAHVASSCVPLLIKKAANPNKAGSLE